MAQFATSILLKSYMAVSSFIASASNFANATNKEIKSRKNMPVFQSQRRLQEAA